MKTLERASVGIQPKGGYNATFGWTRDSMAQQTQDFAQSGGDVLGPSTVNPFTLGTSTLSGSQFNDVYMELEEGGEFRSVSYQITQNGVDEDIEIHSLSTTLSIGAVSTEN